MLHKFMEQRGFVPFVVRAGLRQGGFAVVRSGENSYTIADASTTYALVEPDAVTTYTMWGYAAMVFGRFMRAQVLDEGEAIVFDLHGGQRLRCNYGETAVCRRKFLRDQHGFLLPSVERWVGFPSTPQGVGFDAARDMASRWNPEQYRATMGFLRNRGAANPQPRYHAVIRASGVDAAAVSSASASHGISWTVVDTSSDVSDRPL